MVAETNFTCGRIILGVPRKIEQPDLAGCCLIVRKSVLERNCPGQHIFAGEEAAIFRGAQKFSGVYRASSKAGPGRSYPKWGRVWVRTGTKAEPDPDLAWYPLGFPPVCGSAWMTASQCQVHPVEFFIDHSHRRRFLPAPHKQRRYHASITSDQLLPHSR